MKEIITSPVLVIVTAHRRHLLLIFCIVLNLRLMRNLPRKFLRREERENAIQNKKYVKKPRLRKNSPSVTIRNQMKCCKKNCLKSVNTSHLENIRSNFQKLLTMNKIIYLNGLLHRRETKRASGHPCKSSPSVSSNGKRVGRRQFV